MEQVTQSDRERAATVAPPGLRAGILSGQMDGGKYVRAFAAHRNDASTLPSEKPFSPAKSHLNSVAVLKGALASIIADPDCCAASKAIARNAMRQIRDAKADNASDMEQSQVYRDAPVQVNDAP